jgi:hypothetical protein
LLDAEIRRVETVARQHAEALHTEEPANSPAASTPLPPDPPALNSSGATPVGTPEVPTASVATTAPASNSSATPPTIAEPAPLPLPLLTMPAPSSGDGDSLLPTLPIGPPAAIEPSPPASTKDQERPAKEDEAVERVETPTTSANEEVARLGIADLRLCGRVRGFGEFDPLDTTTLKPGQSLVIYCEMTGLEYEARGETFVSRLSPHLELRRDGGGPIVWEQTLATAEDVCRRRRRDYYVWHRIKLPSSLEPGDYQLRLIQTDLIAERTTSAAVPLTIAP